MAKSGDLGLLSLIISCRSIATTCHQRLFCVAALAVSVQCPSVRAQRDFAAIYRERFPHGRWDRKEDSAVRFGGDDWCLSRSGQSCELSSIARRNRATQI